MSNLNRQHFTTDLDYACAVLLAAGAVVTLLNRSDVPAPWKVCTKDGRTFHVTETAMIELAYTEAKARRRHWQRVQDALQLAMFACEDTPYYGVRV